MLFSSDRRSLRLLCLGKASGLTRAVMDAGEREPLVSMQYWP